MIIDNSLSSKRPISALQNPEGEFRDEETIRPHILEEFVGQEKLVSNLKVYIQAAKSRGEALEHVLFYGPPGLGKTTLSLIMSREMGSDLHVTAGPAIEKQGDLAAFLTQLKKGDILFIDEIHRLRPSVEEILYSAMEDRVLDIVIGKGPTAKTMRLELEPFTLVGATTKLSSLSTPLRDRFGSVMKLDFYTEEEMQKILIRSARILDISLTDEAFVVLSQSGRGTPRIINRLLRRIRDFAQVEGQSHISSAFVTQVLTQLSVDAHGLDEHDRKLLRVILEKFHGGPVGLSTLAAALSEEQNTIEEVYEPYLLQLGFLERTPRGRAITQHGKDYLKKVQSLY